jgi:SulP family sulfate permease
MWRELFSQIRAFLTQRDIRFFTLRDTLETYTAGRFKADLRAAVNVALMAFPQGMAYALIAKLPIKYGIYCSAIATLIGPLMSSSRLTILGPTNATAVLVLSSFLTLPDELKGNPGTVSLLVLLVGLFLVIGSFLNIANLTQYVSRSVVVGYISGAAFLIIANQAQHLMGFRIGQETTFYGICTGTVQHLGEAHVPSLLLSVLTLGMWAFLRRRAPMIPAVAGTLLSMAVVAHVFSRFALPVEMLEPLPLGIWPVTPPEMDMKLFNLLISPAAAIAVFAVLEGTFISKTLAAKTGQVIDSNQDMLSLGAANMGNAFFCGMPASASPVRSALNWASGAVTPLASIFSGLICAAGIVILGPAIGFIPLPALAVMVICAAVSLIDRHHIWMAIRATRSDAAVLLVTFIATLLTPLSFAIFLGVAVSIVLFLRKVGTPQLVEYTFNTEGNLIEAETAEQRSNPAISIIHVEGELFFGAADLFRDQIRRVCSDANIRVVILRLKNARHLDATSVMALEELIKYLRETGRDLVISGAQRDVYRVLRDSGVLQTLGKENFFMASPRNPNISTRNALQRAKELIGVEKTDVRIFYDPAHQAAAKPGAAAS